ncbi:MAG: DUF7507 domain-containing protein, partial [Atribacterota bacterium]
MKDLRFILSIFVLILIVLLLSGCQGVVPSPGATDEDVTTINGQIRMPICCLTIEEMEDTDDENNETSINRYSGDECYDETETWRPTPDAEVELREIDDCKVEYYTTTDEDGNYQFKDVKPGMYILTTYCPTDKDYFLKDVIEKEEGVALDAGIPDCDSTSLAFVIEYIGDTYCHCENVCPCFDERWSKEFKLVRKIAKNVNMEVNISDIIEHKDFGTLCNVDNQENEVDDDLVDLVCSKLQGCCESPGAGGGNGGNGGGGDPASITLVKQVEPECYTPEDGTTLTYSFTITNTGNVPFSSVTLTDDMLDINENIGGLSSGASWDSNDYTIEADNIEDTYIDDGDGTITNEATATGTYGANEVS